MFLKKLQHHLLFFFLSFVLLTQGLIFVASQAIPLKIYKLKVNWFEPSNGQALLIGQTVNLSAKLDLKNKKTSSVYFVLSDANKNFSINFETQKNNEEVFDSLSTWDTADWPTGTYNLSARATIIDEQGKIVSEEESAPIWVKVISLDEYNALLASDKYSVDSGIVSGSGTEDDGGATGAVPISTNIKTTTSSSTKTTSTSTTTTPSNTATTPSSTVATSTTNVLTPSLELLSPKNNTTISGQQFMVRFLTNFSTNDFSIEFINTDNAAISTGSLRIDKTDGYNWSKNLELSDIFINGSYKLLATALVPEKSQLLIKTFDFDLNVPVVIKPEDLFLDLSDLPSNIQGKTSLKAEANLKIDNMDFVIEDSINHIEVMRIKGANTSATSSDGASFLATWDTSVLDNGNYLVYVESKTDLYKVGSTKRLVTIYNPGNDDQATSTPISIEEEVGPDFAADPTNSISTISTITPSAESSIDCQRSGINDQNLCQKYQAELEGSLPDICINQGIFKEFDCESYIFTNKNSACSSGEISDNTACRNYLYEKYKANLQCNISDTSACQLMITERYAARLAYQYEQKNKYWSVIDGLNSQAVSLSTLNNQLLSSGLASSSLPLLVSDKKVELLKIKDKNVLDFSENLFFSSPAVIISDQDGDKLPDDLEAYYGTDINKADSDGDTYLDGEEVANNYSPLGPGKLEKERTALDQVILAKLSLEEPKISELLADDSWQVKEASSIEGLMKISGQATPETWVNIFVYSNLPLLATTKTDASGQWSYSIADPLTEGVHQAYVVSNDKDGKLLVKSAPLTFLVANIKNDLPPTGVGQQFSVTSGDTGARSWTIYYIIGGAFAFLVLLGLILLMIKRRRAKPDNLIIQASEPIVPEVKTAEIKLPDTAAEIKSNTENK